MFSQSEEKEEKNLKIEEDSQRQQKNRCDQRRSIHIPKKKVNVYTGIYLFIV